MRPGGQIARVDLDLVHQIVALVCGQAVVDQPGVENTHHAAYVFGRLVEHPSLDDAVV